MYWKLSSFSPCIASSKYTISINCEYTPVSKRIVVGQCIENTDNSVDSESTIDCGTWTTKAQCLSPTLQDKCIWNANDESYCGYNRNIEKYIEDINSQENVSINNINEITGDTIGDKKDPCKRIQHPSRESCESHGSLWDIYGNRNDEHHYNEKTNDDENTSSTKTSTFNTESYVKRYSEQKNIFCVH